MKNDKLFPGVGSALPAVAVLLLLALSAYWRHFDNPFQFDDSHSIVQNEALRRPYPLVKFFTDASTFSTLPSNQSYRPFVTLANAFDASWTPNAESLLNVTPFRISIFSLYIAYLLLLGSVTYLALSKAGVPRAQRRMITMVVACIASVHTTHAETINYIIARSDLMSAFGTLLAVLFFLRGGKWDQLLLAPLAVSFATLSKEQGAMAGPICFAAGYLLHHGEPLVPLSVQTLSRTLRQSLPVLAASIIFGTLTLCMSPTWVPGGTDRWAYAQTQLWVLVRFIGAFLAPGNLSADSDLALIANPLDERIVIGALLLSVICALIARASRSPCGRIVSFGLLYFLLAAAPTSSVVPLAEVTNDHRFFFPFCGLFLASAGAGALLWRTLDSQTRLRRLSIRAISITLILALVALHWHGTRTRVEVWGSPESLWRDVAHKSPRNPRGLMNYGVALMARGDYEEAGSYLELAASMAPSYGALQTNLGVLREAEGSYELAERHFLSSLHLAPESPESWYFYARFLVGRAREVQALAYITRALELAPNHRAALELRATLAARAS